MGFIQASNKESEDCARSRSFTRESSLAPQIFPQEIERITSTAKKELCGIDLRHPHISPPKSEILPPSSMPQNMTKSSTPSASSYPSTRRNPASSIAPLIPRPIPIPRILRISQRRLLPLSQQHKPPESLTSR